MEIKKVLKGQFQFLNECKSTRNGFCHKTTDGGVMLSVFGQNFVYEYNVE